MSATATSPPKDLPRSNTTPVLTRTPSKGIVGTVEGRLQRFSQSFATLLGPPRQRAKSHPHTKDDLIQLQSMISEATSSQQIQGNPTIDDANKPNTVQTPKRSPIHELRWSETLVLHATKKKELLFLDHFEMDSFDLASLRSLARSGIDIGENLHSSTMKGAGSVRAMTWKVLVGYVPPHKHQIHTTLERKRTKYWRMVRSSYEPAAINYQHNETLKQVRLDVPRTRPEGCGTLFEDHRLQKAMERIMFLWSTNNPRIGYYQGLGDLTTPFFVAFLQPYFESDPERWDLSTVSDQDLKHVEADVYYTLTKMHNKLNVFYTPNLENGVSDMLSKLDELLHVVDSPLTQHFKKEGLELVHIGVRWMICLLVREFNMKSLLRLWDSYIAHDHLLDLHLYVCASLLEILRENLTTKDFCDIMLFFQARPTLQWGHNEIHTLLTHADNIALHERQLKIQATAAIMAAVVVVIIAVIIAILMVVGMVVGMVAKSLNQQQQQ